MISPSVTPTTEITVMQPKPFHRPGFPPEYPTIPSPVERGQSCPTSPSSPCSTASEHDSSLEKTGPTDSDISEDGDREGSQYYRNPNSHDNGKYLIELDQPYYISSFLREYGLTFSFKHVVIYISIDRFFYDWSPRKKQPNAMTKTQYKK